MAQPSASSRRRSLMSRSAIGCKRRTQPSSIGFADEGEPRRIGIHHKVVFEQFGDSEQLHRQLDTGELLVFRRKSIRSSSFETSLTGTDLPTKRGEGIAGFDFVTTSKNPSSYMNSRTMVRAFRRSEPLRDYILDIFNNIVRRCQRWIPAHIRSDNVVEGRGICCARTASATREAFLSASCPLLRD